MKTFIFVFKRIFLSSFNQKIVSLHKVDFFKITTALSSKFVALVLEKKISINHTEPLLYRVLYTIDLFGLSLKSLRRIFCYITYIRIRFFFYNLLYRFMCTSMLYTTFLLVQKIAFHQPFMNF